MDLNLNPPTLIVLAEAENEGERNYKRGHLFENFVAKVLVFFGCEEPGPGNVRVRRDGYELDVETTLKIDGSRVIAECKAYASSLPISDLYSFYGKYEDYKKKEPDLRAVMIACPRFSAEGDAKGKEIQTRDRRFNYWTSETLYKTLLSNNVVSPCPSEDRVVDLHVVVSEQATFMAGRLEDPQTGLATSVVIWQRKGPVPESTKRLLSAHPWCKDLRIQDLVEPVGAGIDLPPLSISVPEVRGSESDFEYHYPASPSFFVGRQDLLETFENSLVKSRGGRLVVLNGQSGWGKSSLCLRFKGLVDATGSGLVFDARAASSPEYVSHALRKAALSWSEKGVLHLPAAASFASVQGCIDTLQRSYWTDRPALILFDQFENALRDRNVANAFRELALLVCELPGCVTVGFSWKTDVVALVEQYQHGVSEDIRKYAEIYVLREFDAKDIDLLLRRAETMLGSKIDPELKRRLREYSQGFPWLFKKLASHVINEIRSGTDQQELITGSLNVRGLFQNDLATLDPDAQAVLREIARRAPLLSTEATEIADPEVIRLFMDRRLVVQVGDKLDLYWDIFKDFLVTGDIPIKESFILRHTPQAVAKLFRLLDEKKEVSHREAVAMLKSTSIAVLNLARDMRLVGLISASEGTYRISDELEHAVERDANDAVAARIAKSMSSHRGYSILTDLLKASPEGIDLESFAAELKRSFPAISAKDLTWLGYARAFAMWFGEARLFVFNRGRITPPDGRNHRSVLVEGRRRSRGGRMFFPDSSPGPTVAWLKAYVQKADPGVSASAAMKAQRNLEVLGVIRRAVVGEGWVVLPGSANAEGEIVPERLRERLAALFPEAMSSLQNNPRVANIEVGQALAKAHGAKWLPSTMAHSGGHFRAWARIAGLSVEQAQRAYLHKEHDGPSLDFGDL